MQSYLKYKACYDRKANASPLAVGDHCFVLNLKADTQSAKIPLREFRWVGPYKIAKVLSNRNYIVRGNGTNFTQILHRIRVRKYNPVIPIRDVTTSPSDWQKDDQFLVAQNDLYAIKWEMIFGDTPLCRINDGEQVPDGIPNESS